MGKFTDFQRGWFVGVRLAGAFVTKTATLLGVSRAAVSQVKMTYTNHGRTSTAKGISGQKPKLIETDRHTLKRIVSINYRTAAANVTAELNIYLEDHFNKNSLMRASQIHTSMVQLQLLNL